MKKKGGEGETGREKEREGGRNGKRKETKSITIPGGYE